MSYRLEVRKQKKVSTSLLKKSTGIKSRKNLKPNIIGLWDMYMTYKKSSRIPLLISKKLLHK